MGLVAHPQRCSALGFALPQRPLTTRHTARPLQQCAGRKALRRNDRKLQQPWGHVRVFAAALADAGDSGKADAHSWLDRQKESVTTLLTPFSDSAINAKLLALCSAQVRLGFLNALDSTSDHAGAGYCLRLHIITQTSQAIAHGAVTAQALCSVATLIHDTYLPIYLQDVLGLSNTKVCTELLLLVSESWLIE